MVTLAHLLKLSIASFLFSASFSPINLWFLMPISVAIFIHLLYQSKFKISFSVLYGFLANALVLSWSKTFVGVAPWILLSILQSMYFIPVGMLAKLTRNPYALVSAILLSEYLKDIFPFGGFGWTRIGFSQSDSPLVGLVNVFGIAGLSAVTLLIAVSFVRPSARLLAFLLVSLSVAPFLISSETSSSELRVRAIQGGVPERGLSFNARAQAVLDNHTSVTLNEFEATDQLIIWPENAIDVDPLKNPSARKKIENLQLKTNIPLISGVILDNKKLFNSAVLFDSSGNFESVYKKRYLTPFGEYIPLRPIASKISTHTEQVTDFTPGTDFVSHRVNGTVISTVICYELLSDSILRQSADYTSLIAVLTNSATFSGSAEGLQQLNIARLRAIEADRYLVSVSTTGPSALIDNRGRVLQMLSDGQVGSIVANVGLRERVTFSVRYGSEIKISLLFLALGFIIKSMRKGRERI